MSRTKACAYHVLLGNARRGTKTAATTAAAATAALILTAATEASVHPVGVQAFSTLYSSAPFSKLKNSALITHRHRAIRTTTTTTVTTFGVTFDRFSTPTAAPLSPFIASLSSSYTSLSSSSKDDGESSRGKSSSSSSSKGDDKSSSGKQRKRTTKSKTMPSSSSGEKPSVTHAPDDHIPSWMRKERTRVLTPSVLRPKQSSSPSSGGNKPKSKDECILYWMQRDVRTADNWALLFARHLSVHYDVPLRVCYALPPPPSSSSTEGDGNLPPKVSDLRMTERHGSFLLGGLRCVESELRKSNVAMDVLFPESFSRVGEIVAEHALAATNGGRGSGSGGGGRGDKTKHRRRALAVVCDLGPLRHHRTWTEGQAAPILENSGVPLYQVDAHNVVPVWTASPKREVGARTLRTKIDKVLGTYMTHYPKFEGNAHLEGDRGKEEKEGSASEGKIDWDECRKFLNLDDTVPECEWARPGTDAALKRFDEFCKGGGSDAPGLKKFAELRNDPNYDKVCSNLSPWINHGHVSFQRLALTVRSLGKYKEGTASFIEEGIIRRELSDNYVYYTPNDYDSLDAAAGWARESLEKHASDPREYLYTLDEFDKAKTHDDLWNAAQLQLVKEGGMHGFMRMYWAKKILEWTPSPEVALRTAQYFNDRYALDGNDPNGFVGVGWSIMGIHDQGWMERDVFGKIRYMNYNGCKRKFNVNAFVGKYSGAKENAQKALSSKKAKGDDDGDKKRKGKSNSEKKTKTTSGKKRKNVD